MKDLTTGYSMKDLATEYSRQSIYQSRPNIN